LNYPKSPSCLLFGIPWQRKGSSQDVFDSCVGSRLDLTWSDMAKPAVMLRPAANMANQSVAKGHQARHETALQEAIQFMQQHSRVLRRRGTEEGESQKYFRLQRALQALSSPKSRSHEVQQLLDRYKAIVLTLVPAPQGTQQVSTLTSVPSSGEPAAPMTPTKRGAGSSATEQIWSPSAVLQDTRATSQGQLTPSSATRLAQSARKTPRISSPRADNGGGPSSILVGASGDPKPRGDIAQHALEQNLLTQVSDDIRTLYTHVKQTSSSSGEPRYLPQRHREATMQHGRSSMLFCSYFLSLLPLTTFWSSPRAPMTHAGPALSTSIGQGTEGC